jgi:hypothetical protein
MIGKLLYDSSNDALSFLLVWTLYNLWPDAFVLVFIFGRAYAMNLIDGQFYRALKRSSD